MRIFGHLAAFRLLLVIYSSPHMSNTLSYFLANKTWLTLNGCWILTANYIRRCYCATLFHWQFMTSLLPPVTDAMLDLYASEVNRNATGAQISQGIDRRIGMNPVCLRYIEDRLALCQWSGVLGNENNVSRQDGLR